MAPDRPSSPASTRRRPRIRVLEREVTELRRLVASPGATRRARAGLLRSQPRPQLARSHKVRCARPGLPRFLHRRPGPARARAAPAASGPRRPPRRARPGRRRRDRDAARRRLPVRARGQPRLDRPGRARPRRCARVRAARGRRVRRATPLRPARRGARRGRRGARRRLRDAARRDRPVRPRRSPCRPRPRRGDRRRRDRDRARVVGGDPRRDRSRRGRARAGGGRDRRRHRGARHGLRRARVRRDRRRRPSARLDVPLLVAGVAATAPQWVALLVAERRRAARRRGRRRRAARGALPRDRGRASRSRRSGSTRCRACVVALSASLGCSLGSRTASTNQARGSLVLALPYAALAAALFGRARELSAVLAAAAMVVSALGFADLLGGLGLAVAWALQAAAFAWLAGRVREPRFAAASLAISGCAVGHAVAIEAPPSDLYTAGADPAAGIPALLVVAGAAALVAWFAPRWTAPEGGGRLARLFADLVGARAWWAGGAAAIAALAVVGAASAATLGLVEAAGVEPAFDWGRVAVVCSLVGARGGALRRRLVGGKPRPGGGRRRLARGDGRRRGRIRPGRARSHAGRVGGGRSRRRRARRRLRRGARARAAAAARVGLRDRRLPRVVRLCGVRGGQARRDGRLPRRRGARARGAYAVLAAGLFRRPGSRDAATSLWAIAEAAAVAAALLLVEGTPLVAAAAALAVALAALNHVTGERRFAPAALVPLALAAGVTFVELAPPKDFFVANQSPGERSARGGARRRGAGGVRASRPGSAGPARRRARPGARRGDRAGTLGGCRGSPPRPASTQARSRSSG